MNQFSWTDKFGLTGNPFKDTLDTNLFFRTKQHDKALIKIRIGVEDKHAIILLTGQSGTGKTIVSQVVLRALDESRFMPAFIFVYPGMGKGALLGAVLNEIGVKNIGRFASERLAQLQEKALELFAKGQRLVLVIDEAHFLRADALHILRTLSNLETEEEKLVTVLLVAEDSLHRRLSAPSYASLRGRITFSVNLRPLSLPETEQYIKYRLLKCGAGLNLFSDDAYRTAYQFSRGIPREINRLLYNAFLEAMVEDDLTITSEILEIAGEKLNNPVTPAPVPEAQDAMLNNVQQLAEARIENISMEIGVSHR